MFTYLRRLSEWLTNAIWASFLFYAMSADALDVVTNLAADATWGISNSPVYIQISPFIIESNATLAIDPGVEVLVKSNITVLGQLRALGTSGTPIVFDALTPGTKWGALRFTRLSDDQLNTNRLQYVDLRNINDVIEADRQTLIMDHCTIDISGHIKAAIQGTAHTQTPGQNDVCVKFLDCTISLVTTWSNVSDTAYGILMNGMPAELRGNEVSIEAQNTVDTFYGVRFEIGDSSNVSCVFAGNRLRADVRHESIGESVAISYEGNLSGLCSSNDVELTAFNGVCGIETTDQRSEYNRLQVASDVDSLYPHVYGLVSECFETTEDAIILNNQVSVINQATNCYIYGIFCSGGGTRGNLVKIRQDRSDDGGVIGIYQCAASGAIENNTVILDGPLDFAAHGLGTSNHTRTSDVVVARNNLLCGNGSPKSCGIVASPLPGAPFTVLNNHNLFYGFGTNYEGCVSGDGDLLADPRFQDTNGHLQVVSPAIDAGTNVPGITVDWEGVSRPLDGNQDGYAVLDIGAVEYQPAGGVSNAALAVILLPDIVVSNGAQWSIVPNDWHSSRETLYVTPGVYTVVCSQVSGWTTPVDYVLILEAGAVTNLLRTYTGASLRVTIQPAAVATNGAQWRVATNAWHDSDSPIYLPPGIHTVSCSYVQGWIQPADSVVTIPDDVETMLTQTYGFVSSTCVVFSVRAVALITNVILRWTDPRACGLENNVVHLRVAPNAYPEALNDGVALYTGTNQMYDHENVTPLQSYYYTIWVSQDATNFIAPP